MTDQEIVIRITGETSKLRTEINLVNKELEKLKKTSDNKGMSKDVEQTTRSFATLAAHLAKIATIYASFEGLTKVITNTAEFEQTLKTLGTVSDFTAEEMAKLSEQAKTLGESTLYGANEVSAAMLEMATAGLNASQILAATPAVLDLATVGMIDLKDAANIAMAAMQGMGLEAKDLGDISDALAKGAANSATTVSELGVGLAKAGAVAKSYGISLAEVTASLGTLSDAGIKAEVAGTNLKIVMQRLFGNEEAKNALDAIGISMYDATGKAKPFSVALKELGDKLKTLSPQARNIKLSEIFGTEAAAAALVLLSNLDKTEQKLKEIKKAMADNFAAEAAKKMADTLKGDWKKALAAVEAMTIEIGEGLTPALREVLQAYTEFIKAMDDDGSLKRLGEDIGTIIGTLSKMVLAIMKAAGVIYKLDDATTTIGKAFGSLLLTLFEVGVGFLAITKYVIPLRGWLLTLIETATVAKTSLAALAMANPLIAALTAAIIGYGIAYNYYTKEIEEAEKANKKLAEANMSIAKSSSSVLSMTNLLIAQEKEYGAVSEANKQAALEGLSLQYAAIAEQISILEKKENKTQEEIAALNNLKELQKKYYDFMVKVGELKVVDESIEKQRKLTEEYKKTGKASEEVIKNLEKIGKAYEETYDKAQKEIDALMKKEAEQIVNIKNIEKEKAEIIRKYEQERKSIAEEYDEMIFQASISNLSKEEATRQEALHKLERIEKLHADAVAAIKAGQYKEASEAIDKYAQLVDGLTKEEWEAAHQSGDMAAFKIAKLTEAKNAKLAAIDAEKQAELEANALKMQLALAELQSTQAQIKAMHDLQKSIIDMVNATSDKKIVFDDSWYKKFNDQLDASKKNIEKLMRNNNLELDITKAKIKLVELGMDIKEADKQARLTIKADTTPLDTAKLKIQDLSGEPATVEIDADTEKATQKKDELISDAEQEQIMLEVGAKIDKAKADTDNLKSGIESDPATVTLDANTTDVDRAKAEAKKPIATDVDYKPDTAKNNAARAAASKDIYVKVHYVPVGNPGGVAAAQGGLIPQNLASGGTFKGHGRVPGYDITDGDKVNARLTGGEYVIRRRAVDKYGVGLLNALNNMKLPRFAEGGLNGSSTSANLQPVTINLGQKSFNAQMTPRAVQELLEYSLKNYGGK